MSIIAPTGAGAIERTVNFGKEGWPGIGGWCASFDPDLTSIEQPALWLQPDCDAIVTLSGAPRGFAGGAQLGRFGPPVIDFVTDGERHLVIDAQGTRHRFWVLQPDAAAGHVILLAMSGRSALAAAQSARDLLASRECAQNSPLHPTDFQRRRLCILLAISDAVAAGASNRETGTEILYPWLRGIDAQAWKASSERRHTQRLIAEAAELVSGGYRRLLTDRH